MSSYEKKYFDILFKSNIKWQNPKTFKYYINNKLKHYKPDFYLPKYNLYIDTKNEYLIKKDKEKIEAVIQQNPIKLKIITKEMLDKNNAGIA